MVSGADWNPNLHPRGWHGRFIKKFKLAPWLDDVLKKFKPREFQSQGQANQFAFNQSHIGGHAFSELDMRRVHLDWDEASDHLRNNDIDPSTQRFIDTMEPKFQNAPPGGLILSRTFTPDALGLRPEQMTEDDPNGIISMHGNTLQDHAYGVTHLGQNQNHGAGKITMSIAVPEGTPVAYSGQNRNDPGVFLKRDQKLLVTQVYPDGQGGWYMKSVAEPPNATSGSAVNVVEGRKGAGLTPEMREARLGGPSGSAPAVAEPPKPNQPTIGIGGKESVEAPAVGRTPEQEAGRVARAQAGRQARVNEGEAPIQAPAPTPAPRPAPLQQPAATPSQGAPSGVPERVEPVHGPIGGTPTEGKSASEIAGTPPTPEAPTQITEGPPPTATFQQAFREAGIPSPTRGERRSQFNDAYLGVKSGRKDPHDAIRDLNTDIDVNESKLNALPDDSPDAEHLRSDIDSQKKLRDFIQEHFNVPGTTQEPEKASEPTPHAPEVPKAPRGSKSSGSQADRNAAAAARRAETGEERPTVAGARIKPGDRLLATKNAEGKWNLVHNTGRTTGAEPIHVTSHKPSPKGGYDIEGTTASGEKINFYTPGRLTYKRHIEKPTATKAAKAAVPEAPKAEKKAFSGVKDLSPAERTQYDTLSQGDKAKYLERRRAGQGHGGAIEGIRSKNREESPRPVARAAKAAAPTPVAAPKAAETKAAETKAAETKAAKEVSDVQKRADEAGLPNTLTGLRGQAREQKIRGFSTMNKEQLQRALLGEEVVRPGKEGVIAPEKLGPHIKAAETENEARKLFADHTITDLRKLAEANGIDTKGLRTKGKIQDAIIRGLRGEETTGLKPEVPEKSLLGELDDLQLHVPQVEKSDFIGKALHDVDDNDPDSLRSERDKLEEAAQKMRGGDVEDRSIAKVAQRVADAMGMRAQRISGVEEEAPTLKRLANKVAPGEEKTLEQHTVNELKDLAKAEGIKLPTGTKAKLIQAIKDHREGRVAAPGKQTKQDLLDEAKRLGVADVKPSWTKAKLADAIRVHRNQSAGGPETSRGATGRLTGRESPIERIGAPTGQAHEGQLGPNLTPAQRLEALGGPKTNRGRTPSQDLVPGDRIMVERDSEGQLVPEMVRGDKAAFPAEVIKQNDDGSVRVRNNAGEEMDTVRPAPRGTSYRKETPTEARRNAPKPAKRTPAQVAEGKKVVPENSVPGDRAQVPIDNSERFNEFQQSLNKAKIPMAQDKTSEASMMEIRKDVGSGAITPEEGIRRLESDISLNQDEIDDINRTIRRGDLTEPEIAKLREQRDRLIQSKSAQEHMSRAMHEHFGKERVTPKEVMLQVPEGFKEKLAKTDPEELRKAIKEESGIDAKGDTPQEVFQDALKQVIKGEVERRAAKKAAKAATPKVTGKRVTKEERLAAEAKPEFSPGGAKHLDAKAIAGDLDVDDDVINDAQAQLNAGHTPGMVAKDLQRVVDGRRTTNVFQNGGWHADRRATPGLNTQEEVDKTRAEFNEKYNEQAAKIDKVQEFVDRIKAARRPVVRKAAPSKPTVAETNEAKVAAKATGTPVKQVRAKQAALKEAEAAAHDAGLKTEADKLRDRILSRHQTAWNDAKTPDEARAATDAMRQDLTADEIRAWARPMGITGRSKDEILRKAVDQRFAGLNPGGEGATNLGKVNSRMEAGQRTSSIGEVLSEIDELHANGASDSALLNRIQNRNKIGQIDDDLAKRLTDAATSRDSKAMDAIARENGLSRNTDLPGELTTFDPAKMRGLGQGGFRKGDVVRIVQPGYQGLVEGRQFQAHPAKVLRATDAEKEAHLKTLGERRAAVAQRLTRAHETNPLLRARKATKAAAPAAPEAPAAAPAKVATKAAKAAPSTVPKVKHANVREPSEMRDRPGSEKLVLPNGGADQGLVHLDSTIGQLWQDFAKDDRVDNKTLNEITDIGHKLGHGQIDVPTARALIRGIKTDNPAVRERINEAVADLDVKPTKFDVPDNTPKAIRDLLNDLNEIPAYHNKGSLSRGSQGPTPFEKIVNLVRDIGNGNEGPGGDSKLRQAIEDPHESGDGVYEARRKAVKDLFPGNQSSEVRQWLRSWSKKEKEEPAPSVEVAGPRNRDAALARERAAAPAKASPAKRALTTKGVESPNALPPLHTNNSPPVKKVTKAAKAAPKITQAELRNPVEKVGTAAPSAEAVSEKLRAHGLTPGEGVPTSNFLALQNKLGSSRAADLRALDRAARIPSSYDKVPALHAKVLQDLQQAGIGPDDPIRKAFEKWFHEHWS